MAKSDPEVVAADEAEPTPVADAIVKDAGPQFVLDQMADVLERAAIEARGRTDDISICWHNGIDQEEGPRVFSVTRDDHEPQHGLSVDEAKVALDAMGEA